MVAGSLALGIACAAPAAEPPLAFGVFPYLSAQRLTSYFAPLRDHLQQASGRQVILVTAPDYRAFRERTRAGAYDLILTAPHFGRSAEKESRFQRIAMTRYRVHGVIVVPAASSIRTLDDLRGKTLAVPSTTTLIYALGMDLLRRRGLQPGRGVTLRGFDNTQNAMAAPLRGDADAALAGGLIWSREGYADKLRPLAETQSMPGFVLMAHPRVPRAAVLALRGAALAFSDTPAGQSYFAATGHGAWLPIDPAEMSRLDRFLSGFAE